MDRRGTVVAAGVAVLDIALVVVMYHAAWAHPTRITIGRKTDAPYIVWAMAWVARAVAHHSSPWVTHALSVPTGVNLMTNASATGLGLALAPVTWLWGAFVAFNVAATAALALTAFSTQIVIKRVTGVSWLPAFAGGLVAGLGPVSMAQEGGAHLHVSALFLVPPLLLGIGRVVTGTARHPPRWGAAIGLLAAGQLLIGEEVLAIVAVTAGVGVLMLAATKVTFPWRQAIRPLLIAVGVFVVVAGWPMWVQLFGPNHIHGALQNGRRYPNDLSGLVLPNRAEWLGGWAQSTTDRFSSEGAIYLGAPLVVVAVWAAWRRWAVPVVRVAALTGAALLVLSLGSHLRIAGYGTALWLPWGLVAHVRFLDSLIPVRFGVVLDMIAGLLLAVGIDAVRVRPRVGRHSAAQSRTGVPAVVAIVCLLPIVPRLPLAVSTWNVPSLFRHPSSAGLAAGSRVVIGPYPGVAAPQSQMWLATAGDQWSAYGGSYFVPNAKGLVTIGGRVPVFGVAESALERGVPMGALIPEEVAVRAALQQQHVAAVLIGPVGNRATILAWWTGILGPPAIVGTVAEFRVPTAGLPLSAAEAVPTALAPPSQ